jgi:hypothetical protein
LLSCIPGTFLAVTFWLVTESSVFTIGNSKRLLSVKMPSLQAPAMSAPATSSDAMIASDTFHVLFLRRTWSSAGVSSLQGIMLDESSVYSGKHSHQQDVLSPAIFPSVKNLAPEGKDAGSHLVQRPALSATEQSIKVPRGHPVGSQALPRFTKRASSVSGGPKCGARIPGARIPKKFEW